MRPVRLAQVLERVVEVLSDERFGTRGADDALI
jgi:hypothetical protein